MGKLVIPDPSENIFCWAAQARKQTVDVVIETTSFEYIVKLSIPEVPVALGFVEQRDVSICLTGDLFNGLNYSNRVFYW